MSTAAVSRRSAGRRGSSGGDKSIANVAGPSAPASNTAIIDVDAIEDEVEALSPSRVPAALRRPRPRRQPITVVIDEDLEVDCRHQGVPARTSRKRRRPVGTSVFDISSDHEESSTSKASAPKANANPAKVAPEPTLICPVCLNKLVAASSTICGHIFCDGCIRASVKAQKKCPNCRRKLTMNNFHRVYLPGTD